MSWTNSANRDTARRAIEASCLRVRVRVVLVVLAILRVLLLLLLRRPENLRVRYKQLVKLNRKGIVFIKWEKSENLERLTVIGSQRQARCISCVWWRRIRSVSGAPIGRSIGSELGEQILPVPGGQAQVFPRGLRERTSSDGNGTGARPSVESKCCLSRVERRIFFPVDRTSTGGEEFGELVPIKVSKSEISRKFDKNEKRG